MGGHAQLHVCAMLPMCLTTLPISVSPMQVDAQAKMRLWKAIARKIPVPEGERRRHRMACRKRWEDLRRWSRKLGLAKLGESSLTGRGSGRTLTPLLERVLAVAYPDLAVRLGLTQQPPGGE